MKTNVNVNQYKVFVGGLSSDTKQTELQDYFEKFGGIIKCQPQTWKGCNSKCRGFAIVQFTDENAYLNVLKTKHFFKGRYIECKKAFSSKKELKKYEDNLIKRKIFVGGLPLWAQSLDLENYFQAFGEVEMAYVVKNKQNQNSKGFGFVCFKNKKDCDQVLSTKKFNFHEKKVVCSAYHAPKEMNTPSSENQSCQSKKDFDKKKINKELKKQRLRDKALLEEIEQRKEEAERKEELRKKQEAQQQLNLRKQFMDDEFGLLGKPEAYSINKNEYKGMNMAPNDHDSYAKSELKDQMIWEANNPMLELEMENAIYNKRLGVYIKISPQFPRESPKNKPMLNLKHHRYQETQQGNLETNFFNYCTSPHPMRFTDDTNDVKLRFNPICQMSTFTQQLWSKFADNR